MQANLSKPTTEIQAVYWHVLRGAPEPCWPSILQQFDVQIIRY